MQYILFFDGSRAYWSTPGGREIRSRVAEPGQYVFTDEGIQLLTGRWKGAPLHWPTDLADAATYLARHLDAEVATDREEYDQRRAG